MTLISTSQAIEELNYILGRPSYQTSVAKTYAYDWPCRMCFFVRIMQIANCLVVKGMFIDCPNTKMVMQVSMGNPF